MRASPALLLAAVLFLAPPPCTAAAADGPPLPDDPLAGRRLFVDRQCHRCHGIEGDGPAIGPHLGQAAFDGSFLDLGAALWNHVPSMSVAMAGSDIEWPEVTAEEAVDLLSFLYFIEYLGRPGDAGEGRLVYRRRGCGACHGSEGQGGNGAPDLRARQRFASPLVVAQELWNHGPAMLSSMEALGMPPPTFQEGELADLSAFLRQRAGSLPQRGVLPAPGNPNRGRALFATKGCAACHGDDARGGDGPDLTRAPLPRSAEAIAGDMWNHALTMRGFMRQRGVGWPTFTAEELADVVAFLYFLPFSDPPGDPARGAAVFAQRSCGDCHGAAAEGGHPAPDLLASHAASSAADLVAAMWSHGPLMAEAILAEGRPWPELSGHQLRDLLAFLDEEERPAP